MSTVIRRLLVKQKKALRIVASSKWNADTQPIFKRFKLLTIFIINKLHICCVMYKNIKRLLLSYFLNLFTFNSDIHYHSTGLASKLHVNRR